MDLRANKQKRSTTANKGAHRVSRRVEADVEITQPEIIADIIAESEGSQMFPTLSHMSQLTNHRVMRDGSLTHLPWLSPETQGNS
jgi:hypothetical protein